MKNILIIFALLPILGFSQKLIPYKINATTTDFFYDKELVIAPAIFTSTNEYNENNLKIIPVHIKNKNFQLSGSIKYPTPIAFSYLIKEGEKNTAITSDFLFLDRGSINITLNNLGNGIEIRSDTVSKANKEYQGLKSLYNHLVVDNGSMKVVEGENIQKKEEILKSYIKTHPNSYVAMWVLIHDYQLYGYSNTKTEIAELFSGEIKNTQSFKALLKKIKADKSLFVNNQFPYYHFPFGQDLEKAVKKSNYTLIDFWATYCKPCIVQFPDLQKIYATYKVKGFDIYSVSIDREIDLEKMNSLIKSKELKWKNTVDFNGLYSSKLNITGIPRNFLLNSSGKIIATDISPENLEIFLKEKG